MQPSEAGQRNKWGTVIALGLASVVLPLTVVACARSDGSGAGTDAAARAADPRTVDVKVSDLRPLYRGELSTTWAYVEELEKQGKAQVVQVYSDDLGNYAYVFDTDDQFVSWACAPTQTKRPLCEDARDRQRLSRVPKQQGSSEGT